MITVSATSPAPVTSSHATAVPSDVRDRQGRAHGGSEPGTAVAAVTPDAWTATSPPPARQDVH